MRVPRPASRPRPLALRSAQKRGGLQKDHLFRLQTTFLDCVQAGTLDVSNLTTTHQLLDEEVRLQVEVEARGAQQHALHVVRAQPEGRVLAG